MSCRAKVFGGTLKKLALIFAAVLIASALASPQSAHADAYDASTSSNLRNMHNAMASYSYFGPTGSFTGVTESGLREQGWSKPADLRVEIWIIGSGQNYKATAKDTRGGMQYSITTTGNFNGNGAGSVGASDPQPNASFTDPDFIVQDLDSSMDMEALAQALSGVALSKICDATLSYGGTRANRGTVSDQTLACYAALSKNGASMLSVLEAMASDSGVGMLNLIALDFLKDGKALAQTPPWPDNSTPRPDNGFDPYEDLPGATRVPRSAEKFAPEESRSVAAIVWKQCWQHVTNANNGTNAYDECKKYPIFASGQTDDVNRPGFLAAFFLVKGCFYAQDTPRGGSRSRCSDDA